MSFILQSQDKSAEIQLRGYYLIPLPDGTDMRIDSAEFQMSVTPEYLSLQLEQSGATIFAIDSTSSDPVQLRVVKVAENNNRTPVTGTVTIHIYDDISGGIVYSGSLFDPSRDTLPLSITKKTGVYRVIVQNSGGISGEMTFAVRSGSLSQIRIVPISSVLVRGARTLAMVRLLDRLGNPISPDLHSLQLDIS